MKKLLLILAFAAGIGTAAAQKGDTIHIGRMPTFHGKGLRAFSVWVASRVHYPAAAFEQKEQGVVLVRFIVDKQGDVTMVESRSKVHSSLISEALSVVKSSPRWEPGVLEVRLKDGTVLESEAVPVRIVIPVSFVLQGSGFVPEPEPMGYMGPVYDYDDVRLKPTFQGGDPRKFAEWMAANVQLPKKVLKKGTFTAGVMFTVLPEGVIESVSVLNVTDKAVREAITKAAYAAPLWDAGGADPKHPTAVQMIVPVAFN